jgi:hypothetical protein
VSASQRLTAVSHPRVTSLRATASGLVARFVLMGAVMHRGLSRPLSSFSSSFSSSAAALVAAVATTWVVGCPLWDPPPPDVDVVAGACVVAGTCRVDRDCGPLQRCDFSTVADDEPCGVCVAVACLDDTWCDDGDACDTSRGRCERPLVCDAGALRATCDDGTLCLVDAEGGACRAATAAARCELVPALAVTASGVAARFDAVALDDEGRLVARSEGALDDTRTCDGPEPCDNDVVVTAGGLDCSGRWVVLPPRAADTVRVFVVDAEDGAPLAGVTVASSAEAPAVTDELGVATLPAGVSFVRADVADGRHDALTLFGPVGDVVLPLRRAGGQAAGGTLRTPVTSDVTLGLAGLSLGDVDDVDVPGVFGASGRITVSIEGVTDADGAEVPFSSGGLLGIGNIRGELGLVVRDRVVAWARPGSRLLWSFGAGQSLSKFGWLFADDLPQSTDIRLEMLRLMAAVGRSGVDARVTAQDAVFPAGRNNDLDELSVATPGAYEATVDVSADVDVTVGALPPATTDVLLLVGAVVRGRGLVLLGGKVARAVVPEGNDGSDDDFTIEVPGVVRVPFAPPHSGLEGRSLVVVAVPLNVDTLVASDRFGAARAVVPIAAPAPDRILSASLPALDRAPLAHVDGTGVLVVDDVGDADRLRLTVRGPSGAHQLWLPAVTGAVDVGDVDLAGAELAAVRFADDPFGRFVTPWESTASVQGVRLP